jgi:methionyl-tRNA formyltransferase
MSAPIDLVFFGTPEFAVPALEALAASSSARVLGVVTQPDAPAGRGQRLTPPPVKIAAQKLGIPVYQPESIKRIDLHRDDGKPSLRSRVPGAAEVVEFLNSMDTVKVFVCVAYGKIIPNALLEFPPHGMVNIHPSLLPRWRGAAPIQHALFAGDTVTGVALMQIDEGLDSGPLYAVEEVAIADTDTSGTLHERLASVGAEMLVNCLPRIISGELPPKAQTDEGVTYAEKWEREECLIHWAEPPPVTLRRIRACNPWPGARTLFRGEQVKVYKARAAPASSYPEAKPGTAKSSTAKPGTVVDAGGGGLIVSAGEAQYVIVDELQFPGKNRLPAAELLRGRAIAKGDVFE